MLQLKMLAMNPGLLQYATVGSATSRTSNVSFAGQMQGLHFIAINCKFCFSYFIKTALVSSNQVRYELILKLAGLF